MKFSKKENIICFSKEELMDMFKVFKLKELSKEMDVRGISSEDLKNSPVQMEEITDIIGKRGAENRDEHEIFAGLFVFLKFFDSDSDICFEVCGFNPDKNKSLTFEDLLKLRERVETSDFLIRSHDGVRKFELKRYREALNTGALFAFISKKIMHYGNNLGDTNLLGILQAKDYSISEIDFDELYQKIASLHFKFKGQILISFNNINMDQVMICVHPKFESMKIPVS